MIIKDDSPLRRIPTKLNREQTFFLTGIRYSISMAAYAYARLYESTHRITNNYLQSQDLDRRFPNKDIEINLVMIDAWSMIDSVHRLRELLAGMPGLKQKANDLKSFYTNTKQVDDLRHKVQHLRHETKNLAQLNHVVWGTVIWSALESPEAEIFRWFTIYAGSLHSGFRIPPFQPFAKTLFAFPIDHISLNAYNVLVSLTDCYDYIEKITVYLEDLLRRNFQEQLGQDIETDASDLMIAFEFR